MSATKSPESVPFSNGERVSPVSSAGSSHAFYYFSLHSTETVFTGLSKLYRLAPSVLYLKTLLYLPALHDPPLC